MGYLILVAQDFHSTKVSMNLGERATDFFLQYENTQDLERKKERWGFLLLVYWFGITKDNGNLRERKGKSFLECFNN